MSRSSARAIAGRLAGRSYNVSRQYAVARMRHTRSRVVVFSMGKTGSTAIARAVQDATGDRVFQVFRLDADRLAQAERRYRVNAREARRLGRDRGSLPFAGALHLWESAYLVAHPPALAAPWSVITVVREPIAQAASAFFHGGRRRGALEGGPSVGTLAEALVDDGWIRAPLRWFDREFAPSLGIDVFDHPFDVEQGFATIETPLVRVLLLRQENLAVAPRVLGQFLGLEQPVPVPARNEATTKEYAPIYRQFLAEVRIPEAQLDQAYESRYARHFYTDTERAEFRQRWTPPT